MGYNKRKKYLKSIHRYSYEYDIDERKGMRKLLYYWRKNRYDITPHEAFVEKLRLEFNNILAILEAGNWKKFWLELCNIHAFITALIAKESNYSKEELIDILKILNDNIIRKYKMYEKWDKEEESE